MYQIADDRIVVRPVLHGKAYATEVWMSDRAAKEFARFCRGNDELAKKLKEAALRGFSAYGYRNDFPLRSEGGGVYRFAVKSALFRLVGFYGNDGEFVVIDAFKKLGQTLTRPQQDRIDRIKKIKAQGLWVKASR